MGKGIYVPYLREKQKSMYVDSDSSEQQQLVITSSYPASTYLLSSSNKRVFYLLAYEKVTTTHAYVTMPS